ncbi:MAG: VanZ family protein [Bacteroidetes bacterium]|nr:VanZ family protein [Bacteroidota bacterium]
MKVFFKSYTFSLLWALLILTVCGMNGSYIPQIHFTDIIQPDSLAHITLFGVQTWLIAKDRKHNISNTKQITLLIVPAFVISVLYGVIIEILQATVFINRSYDYMDMAANTIGCILASITFFIKFRKTL